LRTNANIAFQCAYHVVWCPKYRRRVIGGRMEARLKEIIAEVIAEKGRRRLDRRRNRTANQ
jgi:putative transposase